METEYGILGPLSDDEYKRHYFWFSFAMSQIFGLFVMLVAGFWAALYAGGDSLPMYRKNDTVHHHSSNGVVLFEPYPSFQFHVFFMPYAMVFLVGEGILLHRALKKLSVKITRTLHLIVMITVFCFAVTGLNAIYKINKVHMTSAHSWIGLSTIILFTSQLIFGFAANYYPGMKPALNRWYQSSHYFFGLVIFLLASSSVLMGLTLAGQKNTRIDGVLSKILALAVVTYAVSVVFIVVNRNFSRQSVQKAETRLLHRAEIRVEKL